MQMIHVPRHTRPWPSCGGHLLSGEIHKCNEGTLRLDGVQSHPDNPAKYLASYQWADLPNLQLRFLPISFHIVLDLGVTLDWEVTWEEFVERAPTPDRSHNVPFAYNPSHHDTNGCIHVHLGRLW